MVVEILYIYEYISYISYIRNVKAADMFTQAERQNGSPYTVRKYN